MRKSFVCGLLIVGALLLGSQRVDAGTLQSATFSFALATFPPLDFPATGATGTYTEATGDVTLGAGNAFAATQTLYLTPKQSMTLSAIVVKLKNNAAGSFTGDPQAGAAAFTGSVLNYGLGVPNPLLNVPLNVGISTTIMAGGGGINITAENKKWTAGMTTLTGLEGGATAMLTGGVVPGAPGTVTLVSSSKITTNIAGVIPAFAILKLTFDSVPEPAMPLMLVAGAGTLGLLGRRKLRS